MFPLLRYTLELSACPSNQAAVWAGCGPCRYSIAGLQEALTQDVRPALLVLLGGLIPSLLLLRQCSELAVGASHAREKDWPFRSAIGAGTPAYVSS